MRHPLSPRATVAEHYGEFQGWGGEGLELVLMHTETMPFQGVGFELGGP